MTGFLFGDDADAFFSKSKANPGRPSRGRETPREEKPGATEDAPLSVSQLNAWIKKSLEQSIPQFWLAAEVSGVMQSGAGHVYLTLKDDTNQISAVIWRSTWEKNQFDLRDGMAVLCAGKLDLYGPRGAVQVVIQRIEPQGLGALQLAFRKLHARLEAEGLFRPERKRPLPQFPVRIGFVTSPRGAAIHDFLEVLRRRWPQANVLVIPAKVQGDGAAEEIARGIAIAGTIQPPLDVLIVGRGGGSIEDLWAFNEEVVVRAVAASPIPTVSAVGHEIDVTLCDLAADVRALTPSEAAERVVPHRDEILEAIQAAQARVTMLVSHRIRELQSRLESTRSRPVLVQPERMLDTAVQRLDDLERRCDEGMTRSLESYAHRFEMAASRIEALSPLKTLARGYSLTMTAASKQLVRSAADVQPGDTIITQLADGRLTSTVTASLASTNTQAKS